MRQGLWWQLNTHTHIMENTHIRKETQINKLPQKSVNNKVKGKTVLPRLNPKPLNKTIQIFRIINYQAQTSKFVWS